MSREFVRSQRGRVRRVAVIGAGPAGLAATLECCKGEVPVLLVCPATPRTAGSARLQDGIAAALDVHGDGDDVEAHFQDSAREAGYLLHQAPLRAMTHASPALVAWLDRIGVPFARTRDGRVEQRLAAGSRRRRVVSAGLDTGRLTRDALDDEVRRWEATAVSDARGAAIPGERMVQRLDGWELIELVRDDAGTVIGFVGRDLRSGGQRAFAADAVCLATGPIFPLRAALLGSAAAAGVALEAGALAVGLEGVEGAGLSIETLRGSRPLGDGLLAAGAGLWACDADEERPASVAERERRYLLDGHSGRGLPGPMALYRSVAEAVASGAVYLDATSLEVAQIEPHVPAGEAAAWRVPRRVMPSVLGSHGGLWVDHEVNAGGELVLSSARNHSTSLSGLYAAGDCVALYRGCSELAGNGLLAALFGGGVAARALAVHRESLTRSAFDLPGSVFERAERACEERLAAARAREGGENPFSLADDLRTAVLAAMDGQVAMGGRAAAEERLSEQVARLRERCSSVEVTDPVPAASRAARLAEQLDRALSVAELIAAALARGRPADGSAMLAGINREGARSEVSFPTAHSYECVGRVVPIFARYDTRSFPNDRPRPDHGTAEQGGDRP